MMFYEMWSTSVANLYDMRQELFMFMFKKTPIQFISPTPEGAVTCDQMRFTASIRTLIKFCCKNSLSGIYTRGTRYVEHGYLDSCKRNCIVLYLEGKHG